MKARLEQIGTARLFNGDCRELAAAMAYNAVVTDPPYGMMFRSNHRSIRSKHHAIQNDHDEEALRWAIDLPASHSRYVFCRWDNLSAIPKPRSVITWVKNNHSMGDLDGEHGRQTELILFYPGLAHAFPGKRPTDVIHAARTGNERHPTEKPLGLMSAIVRFTSGSVFDPFMGSGTTGAAAVALGRDFIGIEIDPEYFALACEKIHAAWAQPRLPIEPTSIAVQEAFL